ncbi:T9SS type A sorting domain-containing protein [Poritiphilus flavus]|uniref:T9SS type A sorting domain-containing protein n=1 Tax=Poritiphilus flavus TaxID=2697053 RepID=A0A6L9E9Y8_9FLAO|nr:T9SS type A sorting domain-containing protein [Poritiphilus flavus]NAS11526.1 T9SS type A sorting domain-containing protein [Poritiphilus flavus]
MKKITPLLPLILLVATMHAQTPCAPISTIDCADVDVSLPYSLDFGAPVANSLLDGSGNGTGFTMVLEHSEARSAGDLPVSDPSVNGYEPTLLNLNAGMLEILSQAGIAYLDPPVSSNNNNQVNTLGVGLPTVPPRMIISSTLSNIVTGGGSAQAGIWFGFDEDNFVKLNVNNNDNIELRVETAGTSPGQVQSTFAISGQTVILEMEVDAVALTADAYYTIGAGSRTLLGSLPIPANYFTGRNISGTDLSFAGIYATHRNGSQFTASFDSFDIQEQIVLSTENDILDFVLTEQTGPATINTTAHTVDVEVTAGSGLTALTPTISISADATISPLSGTTQDFSAPFDYTVTAEDGTPQVWTVTVTEALAILCPPISALDCADIDVALPYSLDFNAPVANSLLDGSGNGTGFTMVLEHSEARSAGDLPVSDPSVNGYEPSLLNLNAGMLEILSQAGIAYLDPPVSSNNNNQVNTLGVGLPTVPPRMIISSTLSNIVTGGGSAQAGIWFGFDEDNFVKLNVNNNDNIELRVETAGTSPDQIQSTFAISGQTVILEMEIDAVALTADAYYTIGAGSRTLLGSLPIPANYFTGRNISGTDLSFAGIYATHRNGTQFTASFDAFDIQEQIVLSAENDILDFVLTEQTGPATIDAVGHTVDVEVTAGSGLTALTPTITISTDATISPLSGTTQDFSAPFDYTVTAEDGTPQVWTVTVTEALPTLCPPVSTLDCADIDVALPYSLDFSAPVAASLLDGSGNGTGFTMVLEHSEARSAGDLPVSDPSVNGYEPSLLSLNAGMLEILSQAGIAYLDPPVSSNNNNQVNTLGVGLPTVPPRMVISSTLSNIVTGGGSAQAGIWFGFDEDNFVKLNVNNNDNIELRVETAGTSPDQVQSTFAISGQTVILEMEIDAVALTADAYYTIGAGSRTLLGSLPIPANYFTGRNISGTDLTFAGIYATHRNGTQFTASFDAFDIQEQIVLSAENDILDFVLTEQTGPATIDAVGHTVDVEVTAGSGLTALTPTITISADATISPLSGTTQDFSAPFDYTVTAEDGTPQVWTVTVTEALPSLCPPISTLDCADVDIALPYSLDFSAPVANSLLDGSGNGTGFTMILEHSEARRAGDLPVSDPSVNGYEPSLLNLNAGMLEILSQAGIAYLDPPVSSNNNNQVNTLGVGLTSITSRIIISSTLSNIVTGGGSAQAGIWFGFDEDNFVKLNVNNNDNIELRVETAGTSPGQIQSTFAISGQTVVLEMEVDAVALTADAYYTIGAGSRTLLGSLPIPANYFTGRNISGTDLTFAGIYATHRNGTQFTASFDAFDIQEVSSEFNVNINFSNPTTAAPPNYQRDSGDAYGDRGNGFNYGWLDANTSAPADLTLNGRNRNIGGVDVLSNTLIHMQYGTISTNPANGYLPDAMWEIEVPNGTYTVTVSVGDPTVDIDPALTPAHTINIEGFNTINNFVPSGAVGSSTRFTTETTLVNVIDGRITIDPTGGFNTKINYVEITSFNSGSNPFFTNVSPANNATNVAINDFQANVELVIPSGYELDEGTLAGNVNLFEVDPGVGEILVPSNSNDTGGGDAITLTPLDELKPFTTYIFRLSSNIEVNLIGDVNDRLSFIPFESTFTTGDIDPGTIPMRDLTGVQFTKVLGPALGPGTENQRFSSLTIGPDGKLYASTIGDFSSDGQIYRWDMAADGTLSNLEILSPALQGSPHPVTGVNNNNDRLIIGLVFDPASTAQNLIAYVSHSMAAITDGPEWDGKITRLSGPNLSVVEDIVINLPRSSKDHLTNSLAFDDQGFMYINQGSNSAGGEPDIIWANRPERLLSGAVLKLDFSKLGTLPLDVHTTDDISVINSASDGSLTMSDGTYNPYATNAALTIFSSGIRNAYDLVWHSNGWLYVPTNGTAGNGVNSPNAPSTSDYTLARRIDGLTSLGFVPALDGGETQKDFLYATQGGSYHGHPNPYRGEFVLNHGGVSYSGLPGQAEASYVDVDKYPDNLGPDPNYREPAYDFGKNKSPNGVIEYKSDAFDGKLQGVLMVVRFSGQDDVLVMDPMPSGPIAEAYTTIPGLDGFDDPLDVVEDPSTGHLYVSEYDRDNGGTPRLTLLRADTPATPGPRIAGVPDELIFEITTNGDGQNTDAKTVEITNSGTEILNITDVSITGTFANQFDPVSPSGGTSLNPGESIIYTVTYAPDLDGSNLGYQDASLTITSNGIFNPVFDVGLFGLKKVGYEGVEEPILQDIADVLGVSVNVGWTTLTTSTDPIIMGDEIFAQNWVAANQGLVNITPVGRYSPAEPLPFGWFTSDGSVVTNEVGILADGLDNAQTLFPPVSSGTTSFDPLTETFGIYVESANFGGFKYTQDDLNTGIAHRARTYPAKDRDGNLLDNTYFIAFEDSTDGDYNDYIFLLENATPSFGESLSFDVASLNFTASDEQEVIIPTQPVTLTGTGGVTAGEVNLAASESWVVLPAVALGTPIDIGLDTRGLPIGNYSATITASSPGYAPAQVTINLDIVDDIQFAYQFNFQDPDLIEISPPGYIDDFGVPYGVQSTPQGDIQFGWVLPGTATPADASANARNRNTGVNNDVLRNTLSVMGSLSQSFPTRDWLIDVPNGKYYVNISVGDISANDSYHLLEVNGINVIDFDEENNNPQNLVFFENMELVDVNNGVLRLALEPFGVNAKLNYIQLVQVNPAFLPPLITADFVGNSEAPDVYRGTVDISLQAENQTGSGGIIRLDYILDGGSITSYTTPITVSDLGPHTLFVEAEDSNGNISQETYNFSIVAATGAELTLENMTKIPGTNRGFPADDYYSFHRIGDPEFTEHGTLTLFHDSNIMRLHNTGTSDLIISDIIVSDPADYTYEILPVTNPPATFPITVGAGSFVDINITFITDLGVTPDNSMHGGTIDIVSNADNGASIQATLNGSYQARPGGIMEMDLIDIIDVFGFQTNIKSIVNKQGTIDPENPTPEIPNAEFPIAANVNAGYEGDLIVSSNFVQADPGQPVRAFMLAAFSGVGGGNARFVRTFDQTTVGGINFTRSINWYNSLLPRNNSGVISNDVNTSGITQPFRIRIQNRLTSGGTNTSGSNPHILAARIFKVRDQDGNIVPNEYIGIMDFTGGGGCPLCDWNDNLFYFINIKPEDDPVSTIASEQFAEVDTFFSVNIDLFIDRGFPGNEMSVNSVLIDGTTALPAWMEYNAATRTIRGTPPLSALGTYDVVVNTTDLSGVVTTTTIPITVVEEITSGSLWLEDFSGLSNGTTVDNGATAWTSSRGSGSFEVQGGQFETNGSGSFGTWTSEVISISGAVVNVSVDVNDGDNNKENADFIRAFYSVDGGTPVQFGFAQNDISPQTFSATGLTGSTIQVIVEAQVSISNEFYYFDNVEVFATGSSSFKVDLDSFGPEVQNVQSVLYPNPASNAVWLNPGNSVLEDIIIFDASGRAVMIYEANDVLKGGEYLLNISSLETGVYFVRTVDNKGQTNSSPLVIAK